MWFCARWPLSIFYLLSELAQRDHVGCKQNVKDHEDRVGLGYCLSGEHGPFHPGYDLDWEWNDRTRKVLLPGESWSLYSDNTKNNQRNRGSASLKSMRWTQFKDHVAYKCSVMRTEGHIQTCKLISTMADTHAPNHDRHTSLNHDEHTSEHHDGPTYT